MGNQGLPEVKEKVVDQVLQARLVPEVSLASWVSLVLKEMMVHLARMESEVVLEVPALRVLLERMVKLDLRVPRGLLGRLVTKETRDPLVPKGYRVCPEPVDPQEKMENPVNQARRVNLVHLEFQEARATQVHRASVVLPGLQAPWAPEVELDPQAPKEGRALLAPLGHPARQVPLVCRGCPEREEAPAAPAPRVTRANQAVQVQMEPRGRMVPGVLPVPSAPLAQPVSLEIRVKVVPPASRA